MGLTGFILNATIKLLSVPNGKIKQTIVKAKNLEEIVELFNIHHDATYSVAWIDCLAKGPNFGRSLLMLGEHSDKEISLTTKKQISLAPLGLMGKMLNSKTMQLFNAYYYHCTRSIESFVDYDTFFYPLDHISNWNKMYGKKGFVQYQFVLPEKDSTKNMAAILKEIVNNGQGSFLAVLKRFGPANNNLLSFPMEGLTLALDFKMNSSILSFLDKLDRMVYQYDGRVYLTKDARLSEAAFSSMYKNLDAFREFRAKLGADRLFNSLQSTRLKL